MGPRVYAGFVQASGRKMTTKLRSAVPTSAVSPGGSDPGPSDLVRDVLDFEREWWHHGGVKERAIRDRLGMSTARYYQVLNSVIERPEAVRYDPILVGRLQRARDARVAARAARVFTNPPTDGAASRDKE